MDVCCRLSRKERGALTFCIELCCDIFSSRGQATRRHSYTDRCVKICFPLLSKLSVTVGNLSMDDRHRDRHSWQQVNRIQGLSTQYSDGLPPLTCAALRHEDVKAHPFLLTRLAGSLLTEAGSPFDRVFFKKACVVPGRPNLFVSRSTGFSSSSWSLSGDMLSGIVCLSGGRNPMASCWLMDWLLDIAGLAPRWDTLLVS